MVEVYTLDGEPELVLVHIEVEREWGSDFPGRMYQYFTLSGLRYRRPVFPVAIFLLSGRGGLTQERFELRAFERNTMERESTAMQASNLESQIDQDRQSDRREEHTNSSGGTVPPRPRLIPARYLITPTVTGLQVTKRGGPSFSFGQFSVNSASSECRLTINLRISDTATGKLIATETAEGKQELRDYSGAMSLRGLNLNSSHSNETPFARVVNQALDAAVTRIVSRLSKEPWFALVALQDPITGRVIINAGTNAGIVVGMEFDVYQPSGPLTDPESGELISHGDEVKIGRISVQRLENDAAYCNILEGKSFERGDIVRTPRKPESQEMNEAEMH